MTPANSSNDSIIQQQLHDTTTAIQELQQALQPFITTIKGASKQQHQPVVSSESKKTTTLETNNEDVKNTSIVPAPNNGSNNQARNVALSQSVLALTVATICFLKPRLVRLQSNHKSILTSSTSATAVATATNNSKFTSQQLQQQQQQIRSDLNHIRQLLKKVQHVDEDRNRKRKCVDIGKEVEEGEPKLKRKK